MTGLFLCGRRTRSATSNLNACVDDERPGSGREAIYKSAAKNAGSVPPSNAFAKGVLAPKRTAEANAKSGPLFVTGIGSYTRHAVQPGIASLYLPFVTDK